MAQQINDERAEEENDISFCRCLLYNEKKEVFFCTDEELLKQKICQIKLAHRKYGRA